MPPKHNKSMINLLRNDDLLTEILLWLPAKSLIRFKSVCKRWLSLISSDYLCHQHTLLRRHPKPQPSLILQHTDRDTASTFYWKPTSIDGAMIPYTLISNVSLDHHYKILQSCNGLLLLVGDRNPDFKASSRFSRCMFRVYNPTTKLSTAINPTYNEEDDYLEAIGLAFDLSKSPYYKVVCIICCSPSEPEIDCTSRVEVYDSERCTWKLTPFTPTDSPLYFCGHYSGGHCRDAQYWNNSIFWWRSGRDYSYRFDIAKNETTTLPFPHSIGVGDGSSDSHLQELDGRLYYLTVDSYGHDTRVQECQSRLLSIAVWELGGDDGWVLKQRDDGIACQSEGKCVRLMHDSDGSLQLIYHQTRKMKMSAYNFLHKSFRDLLDSMPPPFDYPYGPLREYLKTSQFEETLALV